MKTTIRAFLYALTIFAALCTAVFAYAIINTNALANSTAEALETSVVYDWSQMQQDESTDVYNALKTAIANEINSFIDGSTIEPAIVITYPTSNLDFSVLARAYHAAVRENPYASLIFSETTSETVAVEDDTITIVFPVQATVANADGTINATKLAREIAIVDTAIASLAEISNTAVITDESTLKEFCVYMKAAFTYDTELTDAKSACYDVDYNIYSVLGSHRAVCIGYASVFQLVADAAGVDSQIVCGYANDKYHAFNIVTLNGAEYVVDTTNNVVQLV